MTQSLKDGVADLPERELAMYIIMRTDLNMSRGKIAAEAGHAVAALMLVNPSDLVDEWMGHSNQKKVVLAVPDEWGIMELYRMYTKGFKMCLVRDAGATELKPNTPTCLGIGIVDKNDKALKEVIGSLPLLR